MRWRLPAAYALGDAGFNFYWTTADSFLLFFYTDIDRLAPANVAFVLLLGRLVDLFAGPLIGIAADHTRTRLGSYRPYLLVLALPLGLSAILLFSKPSLWPFGLSRLASLSNASLFMVAAASSLFALCYSAANVPYAALLSVVTGSETERTRFSSLRFAFAAAAGLMVQAGTLPIVARLGSKSAERGWHLTLLIYSVPASAALLVCGFSSRERLRLSTRRASVILSLRRLSQSTAWWWCMLTLLLCMTAFSCRAAASPFYLNSFGARPGESSFFLAANSAAALLSCLIVSARPGLLRSKTRLAFASSCTGAVVTCGLLFAPADRFVIMALLQTGFGLSTGALVPAMVSISSDLASSVDAFQEVSVVGIVAASSLLAIKLGVMAGLGLVTLALWIVRYQPLARPMSAESTAFRILMSLVPATLLIASALALTGLHRSMHRRAPMAGT